MKSYKEIIEGSNKDYTIYHKSYTSATDQIDAFAKKNGYSLDDETDPEDKGSQMFDLIGTGPKKPTNGKTNKFSFKLYKGDKLQRKGLHAQVYGDENRFELNMYIS